jgi:hypothetical protein
MVIAAIGVAADVRADADRLKDEEIAAKMIELIKNISAQRQRKAQDSPGYAPSHYHYRFNQVETLGCFEADFRVLADLPAHLKQGLFAHAETFPAVLRFANASTFNDAKKDLRGLSIRVAVPNVAEGARTQTFLMNSHPVLFADTPETFLKFIQATAQGRRWWFFLNPMDPHLKALWILFRARDNHASPFDVQYWTTTAAQFGPPGSAAKFSAKPCSTHASQLPEVMSDDYLQENMRNHLARESVCFQLMVQRQLNPERQPIEDPSVLWDPTESPFEPVAEINIRAQQDFLAEEALNSCEQEVFDPWETLQAHKPLGRMNQVRRDVYRATARFRLQSHHSGLSDTGSLGDRSK